MDIIKRVSMRSLREKCVIVIVTLFAVIFLEQFFSTRVSIKALMSRDTEPQMSDTGPRVVYEACKKIPMPPSGVTWPEDAYIHDPEVVDVVDLASAMTSRSWVDIDGHVKLGDSVKVTIELRNGRGDRRYIGGDLVRVWMKDTTKGASSVADVTDSGDGTYTAILTAFWTGQPEVKVAIITPREVLAAVFRRRHLCPPVLMNTGIFKHPQEVDIIEETPCGYDDQVPGYDVICNLTEDNYRRPWYCGKPRNHRLMCADWVATADVNLWLKGYEDHQLSPLDYDLLSTKHSSKILPTNITLNVTSDDPCVKRVIPDKICGGQNVRQTWQLASPTGYFYNRSWTHVYCNTQDKTTDMLFHCLKNTNIRLIGDSTMRQMFSKIQELTDCKWVSDSFAKLKHRPAKCANAAFNFSLGLELPPLPFCTREVPRHYFKSFTANMNTIPDNERVILFVHTYGHVLNYHSHVYYDALRDMKAGIVSLINRNPSAIVVIKGPHSFAYSTTVDHVTWMPDGYAQVYAKFLNDMFKDISDRVIYLNALEVTISTEQWHIHPEDYIVHSLVSQMFNFICK